MIKTFCDVCEKEFPETVPFLLHVQHPEQSAPHICSWRCLVVYAELHMEKYTGETGLGNGQGTLDHART